jgi:hypothetical protein
MKCIREHQVLFGEVPEWNAGCNACHIDGDVEVPVFGQCVADEFFDLSLLSDIGFERRAAQLLGELLQRRRAEA